ncbi:MAG TPA: hypothetical protein VK361_00365 [Rubrobacteraceae bacterium]|nr:hypothetical protein [Rubrobacteraceae bacterium]
MSAPNTTKWIGTGLLGLPLYGVLTFWPSLDPQPDPNTDYEAWARYVSTNYYVLKHLLGSGLGLILAIFGTFALGAYLAKGSAGRLGLVAMVITVLGYALFLMPMGVSTFAAPEDGQAYLAGIEEFSQLPPTFARSAQTATSLLLIPLLFVGNVLLGAAVWRSGMLPRWAGVLWAAAAVVMYPLGLVYAMTIGARSTPPTVLVGALLLVIGGGWMACSVMRKPSRQLVGADVQPRVQ